MNEIEHNINEKSVLIQYTQKSSVFIKSWYEKGIKVLQDFFDEDCNLLVFEAFKCTYNLRNICIMQYNSITTAILKYLRFLHVDRTFVKLLPNPCIPIFSKVSYHLKNVLETFINY